jgi:CRP-like cAMP-binding protein
MNFLERLDTEARDLLLAVARPVAHAKSERLVRHGEASRGAYILREGGAEATVTLPGGEKLSVAKFGAGSVFGEMALIERGTCTATVTATEKLSGWFIEREDFRALVAQRVPAALRVQHALTLVVRGAVEIIARHEKRERRMAVLGPGQLLGYMSALEKNPHGSDAVVREAALILEIPAKDFEALYFSASAVAIKLHRAIQKSLLSSMAQTNRHLTRLISQARLSDADHEGEKLEKARGEQITAVTD